MYEIVGVEEEKDVYSDPIPFLNDPSEQVSGAMPETGLLLALSCVQASIVRLPLELVAHVMACNKP
jgi:hypothetical protein